MKVQRGQNIALAAALLGWMFDGLEIARRLAAEHPADFATLERVPVPGRYTGDGVYLFAERPVFDPAAVWIGDVRIEGRDIRSARGASLRSIRQRIQVVFQDPYGSLNPRHRVETIVAEPLHLLDRAPTRGGEIQHRGGDGESTAGDQADVPEQRAPAATT